MQIASDVLDPNLPLMEAMRRVYHQVAQVLQPANDWERDRLASKIVELVQAGELDAQRLCRAALGDIQETCVIVVVAHATTWAARPQFSIGQ